MRKLISALLLAGVAGGSGLYPQAQSPQPRSLQDGVYTLVQAQRGEALYPIHCDRCHGDDMEGDEAPALEGEEFLLDWKGKTLGDLFERIHVAMPGDRPGILTAGQSADLLAFILLANHFPAGKSELPSQASALRHIPIKK